MRTQHFSIRAMAIAAVALAVAATSCNEEDTTVAVTGVTLSPTTLSLNVGGTATLTATVAPDNATDTTVTWASSDTTKATVSSSGLVKAKAVGAATITVTTTDGKKTATCAVTVTSIIDGGNPNQIRLSNLALEFVEETAETNFGYVSYGGVKPLSDYITGTPKVQITGENGAMGDTRKLTIELDAPKPEALISFEGVATPSDAKYFTGKTIYFMTSTASFYINAQNGSNYLVLVYVDKDATFNGTGNSGQIYTNLSLKQGWNYVTGVVSSQYNFSSATQTLPADYKWRVTGD